MSIITTFTVLPDDKAFPIGYAALLLNVRHGEYNWGEIKDLSEMFFSLDPRDPEWPDDRDFIGKWVPEEYWATWKSEEWGTCVLVCGPVYRLLSAFHNLAAHVMPSLDPAGYTPGGDDDFFDYWPGAMECLREFAEDLTQVFPDDFYAKPGFIGVYHNVVRDFLVREYLRNTTDPGQRGDWVGEIIEDFVNEYASDFGIKPDNVVHYISDLGEVIRNAPH